MFWSSIIIRLSDYQIISLYGHPQRVFLANFVLSGKSGVILFFVLSGFLITYLLLQEQDETSQINLPAFYNRRFLRIFPLYFLILGLSVLFITCFPSLIPPAFKPVYPLLAFTLILFALPNLALTVDNPVAGASHLWSLGVENQFYLIWPLLIIQFKKNMLAMIVTLIILPFLLAHGFNTQVWVKLHSF